MISKQTGAVSSDHYNLPGYVHGAEIIQVAMTRNPIDNISDVVYETVKSTRSVRHLHMSFLVPRTSFLKPAIIYFPGGGFMTAEHNKFMEMRMALAEAGFVVAAAEYRTIPDTFPAPIVDAKAAVRYLRQHAPDYGIDPSRIGVFGDSAGGWLAQMLGTTNGDKSFEHGDFLSQSADVQAVATLYGISDLRNIGDGFPDHRQKVHQSPAVTESLLINGVAFRNFPGASIASTPEKAINASPIGHIRGRKPPFLIMHGTKDTLVSPKQSATLYEGLLDEGNKADYVLIEGAEHGDYHWYQPEVINVVVDWFCRHLCPENT
ncbi:alpha/beta hydrolase [Enterobacter bugandensis]|uniref:alpha/beta hydrolase n=1 Tax=Enterobacter TaxID=547 RepID=UPI0013D02CAE|nr:MULTISPECIES: alpha/beta hydrolase [Enterobacter]HAS1465083.1 alpha/beta hydrolase [Enterobacter hormaechei]ELJ5540593.1 alpha/beta hydrolase [Enterobacter bugandensis]MBE3492532.1 alpha/beta hydrolase [Enterobacter cloacae complex sp. P12RS]MBE4945198.1 alpha/beta hydrolase [Enterobacter cloacae complex sp. P1B]MBE4971227.1 alpha/beta hydrolase [Enterobacter cloacae complex sp. P11RS]